MPSGRCLFLHQRRFPEPSREGVNAPRTSAGTMRRSALPPRRREGRFVQLPSERLIIMTDKRSPLHGLPYIAQPNTSWIERAAFYLQRNWMWTTVVACFIVVTISIGAFTLAMRYSGEAPSELKMLSLSLFSLPFVQGFLFACTFLEMGAARPWMIRAALASASKEERAFLFERILQITASEFRDDPLSRGELFGLFKQARQDSGAQVRRKRGKSNEARDAQIEILHHIVGAKDSLSSR